MRPVAVLRFTPSEGPGYFAQWLSAHAIAWELVALDEGAAVPDDPHAYAGIGMMGGSMSVNDPLPWIAPLGGLLRAAVADDIPVIGHCLGGQLLAQALGATVARTTQPEIGWVEVEVDPAHAVAAREWFGPGTKLSVFQWHYDAFALPAGATRLLTNGFNPNQAYAVDDRHIGLQCHIEMTPQLVDLWCRLSADELPAVSTAAVHSEADIRANLGARTESLHRVASAVYARWRKGLRY